jgi:hypothetical protein
MLTSDLLCAKKRPRKITNRRQEKRPIADGKRNSTVLSRLKFNHAAAAQPHARTTKMMKSAK